MHRVKIEQAFESMILEENIDDCNLAYKLLSRLPNGIKTLVEIYQDYVSQIGRKTITIPNTDMQLVY
jgi:hypothetical protein